MSNLNEAQFGYRGGPQSHKAPTRQDDMGRASMHDFEDMMPGYPHNDLKKATQYYGHDMGGPVDRESHDAIRQAHGNPEAPVKIYRAMPKGVGDINPGDWVTPSKSYAKQHQESNGAKNWKIAEAVVPAKHLYTEGYHAEWGYDPS